MEQVNYFNNIIQSFNLKATCVDYNKIDSYFYYDLKLSPSAKVRDINKYADEIALTLKSPCKPSVKVIHDLGIVRLEFAYPRNNPLLLFDYFTNDDLPNGDLICLLGQTVDGQRMWMDLSQNPHMIIAGTTGSGKSTLLHNIIANLFNYNDAQLFLIDPKNIEFSEYGKKLLNKVNVAYSYEESVLMLDYLIEVMENRYSMIRQGVSVQKMPYIVVIIDEFADLILQDRGDLFYSKLCRLAQKCRAARINLILSTQRPSVNIINGTIKANFPARIACKVVSHIDSKVILDTSGAENLLGKGDALVRDNFRNLDRFQIAYTDALEVCKYFGIDNNK